jgi:hypothetical protein
MPTIGELVRWSTSPQAQICEAHRRKSPHWKDKVQKRTIFQDFRKPDQEFRFEGYESGHRLAEWLSMQCF